jgi:hypothetical protein
MQKISPQRAKIRERQKLALEMRMAGATYRQIAVSLIGEMKLAHYTHVSAYRDVTSAYDDLCKRVSETAEVARQIEVERLDAIHFALWSKALGGDLPSVDRILAVMARRARLLGLDEPAKSDITSGGKPIAIREVVIERDEPVIKTADE